MSYSNDEKALIYLSQFDFITSSKFEQILSCFNCPSEILEASSSKLYCLKDILKEKYEIFLDGINNYSENFFSNLEKRHIQCLTIKSQNYPQKLLNLKNPPYVLYYTGDISLINTQGIAIVGTRSPSQYGKIVTEKYAKELAENNLTIISGMAGGVDKMAHEGALSVNGKTIAVLGGGFDHIYPAMNIALGREIAKKGLLLTEYYLTVKPTKFTFPTRNRIIAALSSVVLITEAGEKSGSLYTKEYADLLGIDTYCVPGNITSEYSISTNRLIKSGAAGCTTEPGDILKALGKKPITKSKEKKDKNNLQLSLEQNAIIELLKDGEKDFDFLQIRTGLSTQILNFNLTTLEIRGIIKKLAGNSFVLC